MEQGEPAPFHNSFPYPMPKVLAFFCHPDDIELLCAGTLRHLVQRGWELRCVTMTGGDLGASTGTREAIRSRRLKEAEAAAERLGGSYACAGLDDLAIHYCEEQLRKVTRQIRDFDPDVIITHSPDCYMLDHEETSRLVRMGSFGAGIPLFEACGAAPTSKVPALYYADAIEFKDKFGKPVEAGFYVDVAATFADRQEALARHESQREWLRSHHGIDEYLIANERMARECGEKASARSGGTTITHAEGFRQHLGHGYPQRNILAEALHDLALVVP